MGKSRICPNCKLPLLKRPRGRKIKGWEHHTFTTKKMKNIIGWIGMVLVLLAYFLLNFKLVEINSLSYLILNIVGALAIIYESAIKKSYPVIVLNAIWILVAIISNLF